MSLLFVHDFKGIEYNGEVYDRSFSYKVWKERYLNVFGSMTVCNRLRRTEENPVEKMEKSSGVGVKFREDLPYYMGPEVFINRKIRKIIREEVENNQACIVRLDSFLGLLAIDECRKAGKKYLIEVAGCAWDSFWNHGIFGKILAPFVFYKTKKEILRAPYVVYVTKEFLQHRYPTHGKKANISNVELKEVESSILKKRIDKIIEKKENTIVLGTAANVDVKYKGQQYVIDALSLLKKEGNTQYVYQIAGPGDQSYLRRYAKKKGVERQVIFMNSLSHEQIFEWLDKNVDIYIQPSLQEGLPRAVIEAMSRGCPCIGTRVAGIPELIEREFTYSTNKNMGQELAKLIKKMNLTKQVSLAKTNYEKAKEYTSEKLEKRRELFFKEYLAGTEKSE